MSQKYQNEVIESCLFVFFYFVKTHQSQAKSRSVSKQIFDYRGVIFVSVSISMDFSCQKLIRFNEIHKLRATSESTLSKSLWSDPIKLSIQWTIIIELKQHVINDKLGFHQRAKKKTKNAQIFAWCQKTLPFKWASHFHLLPIFYESNDKQKWKQRLKETIFRMIRAIIRKSQFTIHTKTLYHRQFSWI